LKKKLLALQPKLKNNFIMITAQDVNKLRQMTGAGMMDCKKALTETNGDFEAAIDFLRKKGAKIAANRADRESSEGVAIARTNGDNTIGMAFTLNCETDFVAKNADFIALANKMADIAMSHQPADRDAFFSFGF
jgi:elongation factor Ts